MKFKQYLTEEQNFEYIFSLIKKDCKPYTKQLKGKPLYRGTRKGNPGIIKITPRKNRSPMSIHPKVQIILDGFFKKKFGWKARSEGVFATGELETAAEYGTTYSFWPIGKFKYIWSPEIPDLFEGIWDISQDWVQWFTSGHNQLSRFVDTYTDKNLVQGIKAGHEIMVNCKGYYLVLTGYDGEIFENL